MGDNAALASHRRYKELTPRSFLSLRIGGIKGILNQKQVSVTKVSIPKLKKE